LRHDPDVILIGEIRDAETAQIAVQASLTGHLGVSTLHTMTRHRAGAVLVACVETPSDRSTTPAPRSAGFGVTDFADENHVRVMAQNRAQPARERQAGFFVHLDLIDALKLVFHRVFTVMILRTASLISFSAVYSVEVLPEPVGPVTKMMPCGKPSTCLKCSYSRVFMPI